MARIRYPDPDTFDADTRSVLDKLPPPIRGGVATWLSRVPKSVLQTPR